MTHRFVLLVALAACKGKDLGPVHDGLSRVDVRTARGMDRGEHYIEVSFTARVAKPTPGAYSLTLRAACQVGVDRLVDDSPLVASTLEPGVAVEVNDSPFLIHPLPAEPSLCDLTLLENGHGAPHEAGRACWDGTTVKDGPCPTNNISHVGVGPTGVTAVLESVTPEDADDIGFPAHLTVRYRATAHKDIPAGAYFVRMTSCPGYRSDDTWHSQLGGLRTGESIFAGQNTYKLGRPKAGTPCETVFGYSPEVRGEITELATFCHRDTAITPGECPR